MKSNYSTGTKMKRAGQGMTSSRVMHINQTFLTEKDSIKYLDIMLDSNLSWKNQVHAINFKFIHFKSMVSLCGAALTPPT